MRSSATYGPFWRSVSHFGPRRVGTGVSALNWMMCPCTYRLLSLAVPCGFLLTKQSGSGALSPRRGRPPIGYWTDSASCESPKVSPCASPLRRLASVDRRRGCLTAWGRMDCGDSPAIRAGVPPEPHPNVLFESGVVTARGHSHPLTPLVREYHSRNRLRWLGFNEKRAPSGEEGSALRLVSFPESVWPDRRCGTSIPEHGAQQIGPTQGDVGRSVGIGPSPTESDKLLSLPREPAGLQ